MIKRSFFLLSTATFFFWGVNGSIASDSFTTHTQHTPMELKPVSLSYAYKTASVCFLGYGNCGSDGGFNKGDNYELDTAQQCKNEGFNITSCTSPYYLYSQCPYDGKFYKECRRDNARACKDSGYSVTSCGNGYVAESSCPYDSSYKKCKCNSCDGFGYTYAQATAQGYVADGSCLSCATTKYKRKQNPCSGYKTCECGGAFGASVCYTGSVQKFNNCKTCCANECSLSSCPNGNSCRYEACSNKYCVIGCVSGFTSKNGNCEPDRKCQVGWIYYADGTCVTPAAHNTSKVALGVVVYVNPDGIGGQVMSAWPVDANGNKSNSNVSMIWGGYGTDIPSLPNYATSETAMIDFNSCSNTDKIVAAGDSSTYPAAWAARKYVPTTETKGKWCLPAAGVMTSIYNNQSAVQAGISKLGGVTYPSCCTRSSSETFDSTVWHSNLSSINGLGNNLKTYNYPFVRPVLEF